RGQSWQSSAVADVPFRTFRRFGQAETQANVGEAAGDPFQKSDRRDPHHEQRHPRRHDAQGSGRSKRDARGNDHRGKEALTDSAPGSAPTGRGNRCFAMARALRILAWTTGVLLTLVVVAVGLAYLYVTSDEFRSRIEGQASSFSGRKTTIAEVSIDWGL